MFRVGPRVRQRQLGTVGDLRVILRVALEERVGAKLEQHRRHVDVTLNVGTGTGLGLGLG